MASEETWTCIIPGEPVAQARPRATRFGDKGVRLYDTERVADYKAYAKKIVAERKPAELFDCPLKVTVGMWVTRPKSRKKARYPDRKPDVDNLVKTTFDFLEGLVYTNDSRVVDMAVMKRYAPESGPCAIITVEPMERSES